MTVRRAGTGHRQAQPLGQPARLVRVAHHAEDDQFLATGAGEDVARSSLRFSLGHTSSRADVDALVEVLPGVVERARRAGSVLPR